MRSLFAVSILGVLLCGCFSTKDDATAMAEGTEPGAEVKASNEPCPAPLVAPAESKAQEQAGEALPAAPAGDVKVVGEATEPVKMEDSTPDPTSPSEPLPPPAELGDKPDVQSHMDVEALPPEIPDRRDYFVTAAGLNVRSAPSAQSAVVRQLKLGEKVTSWGREGIWVQIADSEYVSIIYLSDRPAVAQASNPSN